MNNFLTFFKQFYSYFVYGLEAIIAFICGIVAFIRSRRSSSLEIENDKLFLAHVDSVVKNHFFSVLPSWISRANTLYPFHGDGLKRFDFVYQKALILFNEEPSEENRAFVSESIDAILNADKLEKLYYPVDTQGFEPKKDLYEKEKTFEKERQESLREDCEENKGSQCSARYVSRRD